MRKRAALGSLLLPVLMLQGLWLRATVPRLPQAAGATEGTFPGEGPPIRLLVLGESTVAGVGASSHEQGLAGRIAEPLARGIGRAVRWRVLGRNGVTARATRTELLEPAEGLRADVAVIALGVNDSTRLLGERRWVRDLQSLISVLHRRCGEIPVFLAAVPPMGLFPALPQPLRGVLGVRAALLDRAARRLCERHEKLFHVPMPGGLDGRTAEYFCEDGFHPSPAGYRLWGEELSRAIAARAGARSW